MNDASRLDVLHEAATEMLPQLDIVVKAIERALGGDVGLSVASDLRSAQTRALQAMSRLGRVLSRVNVCDKCGLVYDWRPRRPCCTFCEADVRRDDQEYREDACKYPETC